MKLWIVVVAFLLIGGYIVVESNNLNLKEGNDRGEFIYKFASWTFQIGGNMKQIAGAAVKMDWVPKSDLEVNESGNNS